MAQTKKKSIFFVVALVVLAALIVILAATLSACSGDEDEKTEPTPTETVQSEATIEPDSANLPTGAAAGSTGSTAVSGSNSTAAKQPTKSSGSSSSSTKNDGGSKDNGRDKVDYIMNYGDNVEKGVETAADNFVGSLKDIGKAYDKGDVEGITNTVDDFSKGLGDFLGGIKGSIVP